MDVEKLRKLNLLNELLISLTKAAVTLKQIKKLNNKKKSVKRKRSCHVRRINRTRNLNGFYKTTFLEVKCHDQGQFFNYTRMTVHMFNNLLSLIRSEIETSRRSKSSFINAECRLSVTLLYLSQGTSIQNIANSFKLGKETVRAIILETTNILWNTLYDLYVPEPKIHDYEEIERDFRTIWNFPNCIGAIDGRHIALQCPPKSGDQFLNYKKYDSVVLIAACDAKYRFTHIEIGAYASEKNSGIFQNSLFGNKILKGTADLPPHKKLPDSDIVIPHFFLGDASLPLAIQLMRPYTGKNVPTENEYFNKRLLRARRTIENAFGILIARWRILQKTIYMQPNNAEKIVSACVLLHNFIMRSNENGATDYFYESYVDREDIDGVLRHGLWRSEIENMLPQIRASATMNHYGGRSSTIMRDKLRDYIVIN